MKYINTDQLEKIKLTKDNFFVAIDFDRTITAKESCDSWDASGNILGKDFQKQAEALYEKYGPIEQDYTISFEEKNRAMEEWYHKSLELYYEHHLTKEQLEKSIAQQICSSSIFSKVRLMYSFIFFLSFTICTTFTLAQKS